MDLQTPTPIGPLITTFSPPSDCGDLTIAVSNGTLSPTAYPPTLSSIASSCYPPLQLSNLITHGETSASLGLYYYSPGIICPYLWDFSSMPTIAEATTTSGGEETELKGICCPYGYDYTHRTAGTDVALTDSTPATLYGCVSTLSKTTLTTSIGWALSIPASQTIGLAASTEGIVGIEGIPTLLPTTIHTFANLEIEVNAIFLRYKSSDFPTTTRTRIPSTGTPSPTHSAERRGGLSSGAKIGIGVGVPIGAIALAIVGAILCLRHRKKKCLVNSQAEYITDGRPEDGRDKAELQGSGGGYNEEGMVERKPELDTTTRHEVAELSGSS
jgi:hypothetical protein